MIRCGRWAQTLIRPSVSKMVSFCILEVFPRIYGSWAEAFVCLKYHKFRVRLVKANSSALLWVEIVADGEETELRF